MDLTGPMRSALDQLKSATHDIIESTDEFAIWRHQIVGKRNPRAENHMGEDPSGFHWQTKDFVVRIRQQDLDDLGRKIFYARIEPVHHDLLITVAGAPQTEREVLDARKTGYYRVIDHRTHRTSDRELISTKIITEPDRSGQWGSSNR
jgi:hypothetical protein